jgi:hypothetical protein
MKNRMIAMATPRGLRLPGTPSARILFHTPKNTIDGNNMIPIVGTVMYSRFRKVVPISAGYA